MTAGLAEQIKRPTAAAVAAGVPLALRCLVAPEPTSGRAGKP